MTYLILIIVIVVFILTIISIYLYNNHAHNCYDSESDIDGDNYTYTNKVSTNSTNNVISDFITPIPYEIGYIQNSPQSNANLLGGERYPIKQPYVDYTENNTCFDCGK